jgi:hypothetical protein
VFYTIMLRVPPHTRIAAHSHCDDRVATVISGTWRIGYGDSFDEARLKALPPGAITGPPGQNHFAETRDEPVLVQITGFGPSSTDYADPDSDPRKNTNNEMSHRWSPWGIAVSTKATGKGTNPAKRASRHLLLVRLPSGRYD